VTGCLLHCGNPHLPDAVRGVTGDVLAGKSDCAAGWHFETNDQFEQSAFSRTVWADDGENLAIVDIHGYLVNSGKASIVFLDLIQLE
jgi:hypothetical protein